MKKITSIALLLISCFLLIFFINCCKNRNKNDSNIDTNINVQNSEKEAQFLIDAANINLQEIELGNLAQQKATMIDVRELGRMMCESHFKAQQELIALAQEKLIMVPIIISEKSKKNFLKLEKINNTTFDENYCEVILQNHQKAIIFYQNVVAKTNDKTIRLWALSMIPLMEKHLLLTKNCNKKLDEM